MGPPISGPEIHVLEGLAVDAEPSVGERSLEPSGLDEVCADGSSMGRGIPAGLSSCRRRRRTTLFPEPRNPVLEEHAPVRHRVGGP